jgi:hypothetical protein
MAIMQPHGPLLKLHQFRNDGGAAVFRGDLVEMDVDGKISAAEATDTQLYGVSLTYVAASTTTNVPVACDPDQWFEGDQDGTVAVVNIGSNMDHAVGGGGSTTTGNSTHVIDTSDVKSATAGLRIIDQVRQPNTTDPANPTIFIINEHAFKTTTGLHE